MGNELYGSLKVDTGIRRIGVNDDGDYIELSMMDVTLFDRFSGLIEWFEEKQKYLTQLDAEIKARHAEDTDSTGRVLDVIHARTDLFTECCDKLDNVFGAGCCRKVFGDVIPDEVPIMDFLDQISPIMERMAAERGEKLRTKYSRNRKKQRTKDELIADFKTRKELDQNGDQTV